MRIIERFLILRNARARGLGMKESDVDPATRALCDAMEAELALFRRELSAQGSKLQRLDKGSHAE